MLEELIEKLKSADGYMLTISILNGNNIEHSIVTNNFRTLDMMPSHKETKDLIVNELETLNNAEITDIK